MEFSDLTEEQRAKAIACKSQEELLALAKAEGVKLSEEELSAISGGWGTPSTCSYENISC